MQQMKKQRKYQDDEKIIFGKFYHVELFDM